MAFFTIEKVKVSGISASVPKNVYSNLEYSYISEKERTAVVSSTGILHRRFADEGVCTSDIGLFSAEKLIDALNWNKEEIELLIFVSQTRDFILPNTACILQYKLGLSKQCMAFDVPLGCSGYTYGLSIASGLMTNGSIKKALLIVGDVTDRTKTIQDKSVFPIFGDAVTTTALEYTGNSKDCMKFDLQTDGNGFEAIIIPDGGCRNPINKDSFVIKEYEDGIFRANSEVALNGLKVFEFSVREVASNIKQLLKRLDKTTADFDYYIFHQANKLINETIRKQLKLEPEKVPYSLEEFGNTSSASIPLTLVTKLNKQLNTEKHNYILSGFGVGLSWGSVALNLEKIICPPIFEYK